MTISARVHNGTIPLPAGLTLPEGAEVQIVLPDPDVRSFGEVETPDWLRASVGMATSGLSTDEIMRITRGEGT